MKMKQLEKREKRNVKEKWCDFNLENYKKISFFFFSSFVFSVVLSLCSHFNCIGVCNFRENEMKLHFNVGSL